MRFVGFLIAVLIIIWVVGTLYLYINRNRHKDDYDSTLDPDERRHRQRMVDEEKQRHRSDELPPW